MWVGRLIYAYKVDHFYFDIAIGHSDNFFSSDTV